MIFNHLVLMEWVKLLDLKQIGDEMRKEPVRTEFKVTRLRDQLIKEQMKKSMRLVKRTILLTILTPSTIH